MTLPILVTSPRITPDSVALMEAAMASEQKALRLPSFRPTDEVQNVPIAVYGESLFAIILTSKLNHLLIEPTPAWLPDMPAEYTQRELIVMKLGEARQLTIPRFVKTADGTKGFEAKVYKSGVGLPGLDFYPDDHEVLVSEPVTWEVEYRCFVRERELLTLSVYMRNGELALSDSGVWLENTSETGAARQFCESLLQDQTVDIPPACVIDVGRISKRGWAVVEANPAYGSGIYGCDPVKTLKVINRTTIQVDAVTETDAPWVKTYVVGD